MFTQNDLSTLVASFAIVFALLLSGCNSTDSDSDSNDNSDNGSSVSFSSGPIAPGESYSYTFTEEGEIEYYCEIHAPDMQGKITVTNSADAVDRDTVSMENDQFIPDELSVAPNTEVVWVNNQGHDHDISSGNPSSNGGGDTPQY
jgi:plastocyanin